MPNAKRKLLVLNGSRIGDWMRCPRYARYRAQYRSPVEDTHAVDFGTAIHAALEEWYCPDDDGHPTMDDEAAISAFRSAIDWEQHDQEAKEVETSGYGETLLRRYFDYWREVDSGLLIKGREVTLTGRLVIEEVDLVLVGRLDAIIADDHDRVWHLQHKTASAYTSPTSYVQGLELSPHETIYRALGHAHGIPIVGSVINMLRKMKLPRGPIEGWTPFHRERVTPPASFVRSFLQSDLKDIVLAMVDGWDWRSTISCTKWNRICEYHPLCSGLPIDEDDYVAPDPDYVVETKAKIESGEMKLDDIPQIPLDRI